MALRVHSHALENLKLVSVAVNFQEFGLVFLEESRERQLLGLRLGVSKIRSAVRNLIEVKGVVFSVLVEPSLEIVSVPLKIFVSGQLGSALANEVVFAADVDDRVRVNVLLELGLQQVCQFFFVDFFRRLFFTILVDNGLLFLRRRRRDNEDFTGSLVADRVAVKNVTAILAVVLRKTPAESLAHQF